LRELLPSANIGAGELQVVQCASPVEEEGITAPAREEAVIAGVGHQCLPPRRDRCPVEDKTSTIAHSAGVRTFNAARISSSAKRRFCEIDGV
jgi:hypothetical protein